MLTQFFLERPRFAQVIALVIFICGLLCLPMLPTLEYPEVTPPQVQVKAFYIGATADQIERAVANPIELQVNGVENMMYMSSRSANDGTMTLTVTFKPGTDPDIAALSVQNRVELAKPWLPREVLEYGVDIRKSFSTQLMFVSLYSNNPAHDETWLSNYVSLNLKENIARLPGVGQVELLGKKDYSLRIWLDTDRMTSLGLTPADVEKAVSDQNRELVAGKVGQGPSRQSQPMEYVIEANSLLKSPEEFADIVLRRGADGKELKLGDIARIEQGAENYNFIKRLDDAYAIHLSIFQTSDANGIEVSNTVRQELARLSEHFPEGMRYMVPYDSSNFVRETVRELEKALLLTVVLVILVIYLFLADWKATLVPTVTIPVSLVGSFALLYMLGYTLNTVTLFGLVLAVGIVVDDAIVVVENVQRQIQENRLSTSAAVIAAMKEVTSPIIATTLVLLAVFFPIGFIPGTSGQFYKEFGVATSSAVVISSLCALTLSPAMCAQLLSTDRPVYDKSLKGRLQILLRSITAIYLRATAFLLRNIWLAILILAGAAILVYWQFKTLPKGFVPNDDRSFFYIITQLPDSHAINRTDQTIQQLIDLALQQDEVIHTISVTGFSPITMTSSSSSGFVAVMLKPWHERLAPSSSAHAVMMRVQQQLSFVKSAESITIPPSAIPALSMYGGFDFKLQDRNQHTPQQLSEVLDKVLDEARKRPEILLAFSLYRANEPRLEVVLDRHKLKNQDVSLVELQDSLQSHLGSRYIGRYFKYGRVYQVLVQADEKDRSAPDDILELHARAGNGKMVPLSTLINVHPKLGPSNLERYNLYRTASIIGQPAPGYTTEDAMKAMEEIAGTLPDDYGFEWSGLSLQQRESGQWTALILILATLFAYLFLVAQFESWILPLAVMASIPLSMAGAFIGISAAGFDNNIYVQLGLILLIGLAAKNAILIVEFARARERLGETPFDAALASARLRFRAVTMTGLSFIFGVLPLLLTQGAGALGRQSVGTPVFWGMLTVAILSTLLTPAFYLLMRKMHQRISH